MLCRTFVRSGENQSINRMRCDIFSGSIGTWKRVAPQHLDGMTPGASACVTSMAGPLPPPNPTPSTSVLLPHLFARCRRWLRQHVLLSCCCAPSDLENVRCHQVTVRLVLPQKHCFFKCTLVAMAFSHNQPEAFPYALLCFVPRNLLSLSRVLAAHCKATCSYVLLSQCCKRYLGSRPVDRWPYMRADPPATTCSSYCGGWMWIIYSLTDTASRSWMQRQPHE